MPGSTHLQKAESFNFRIDPALKSAFLSAAEADDKPAAQLLRDFMQAYVKHKERQVFAAEAVRQSRAIAAQVARPGSDEQAVMREIAAELDRDDFAASWTA